MLLKKGGNDNMTDLFEEMLWGKQKKEAEIDTLDTENIQDVEPQPAEEKGKHCNNVVYLL